MRSGDRSPVLPQSRWIHYSGEVLSPSAGRDGQGFVCMEAKRCERGIFCVDPPLGTNEMAGLRDWMSAQRWDQPR